MNLCPICQNESYVSASSGGRLCYDCASKSPEQIMRLLSRVRVEHHNEAMKSSALIGIALFAITAVVIVWRLICLKS